MRNKLFILFCLSYMSVFAQDLFKTPVVLPGATSDMSQGVAFGDYDNDGWTDFIVSRGNDQSGAGYTNYLFKSSLTGISNHSLAPFSTLSILSGAATWADIENDGDIDLYIAGAGPSNPDNNLIINNGDGTFTNVTGSSTYGAITTDNEDSRHVGFGDYNNDGFQDVFVDNGKVSFGGPLKANNSFYSNDGDGTYTKETESTIGNIAYTGTTLNQYRTFGSGFGWTDYNNDGYLDIFNCSGAGDVANILWKNNSSTGMFDDVTPSVLQVSQTSFVSSSWIDYDNDGDMDLFTCNLEDGTTVRNFLFQNNSTTSTTSFTDMSSIGTLVTDTYNAVSSTWGDFDNDGDLDVFVSNKEGSSGSSVATLYENSGNGSYTFSTVKNYGISTSTDFDGRGVASGDVNNDGFLDIVAARNGSPVFFENLADNSNSFVNISLVGTGSTNTSAIGSRVKVKADIPEQSGEITQLREVSGQTGGGGQNDMRNHFGLGTTEKINEVKVQWLNSSGGASRHENVYSDLPVDKFIIFTEGELTVTSQIIPAQNFMYLFGNSGGSVEFTTADADGGSLTMIRINSDPAGTFDGNSATTPGGSTITPTGVYSDSYWTITQSGLTGFNSTVYFDASSLTGSPDLDEVVILKRSNSSSDWTALNTERIGNTLFAENVSSFSEFAIGYQEPGVRVETKIFLEGAYDIDANIMKTDIYSNLPTTSPYGEDPETVLSVPANIVDWVLVELRTTDNGTAVASESAFLRNDGRIVGDDGTTEYIELNTVPGNYYIVIKHRNHLAVMSESVVSLSNSSSTLYDFTN